MLPGHLQNLKPGIIWQHFYALSQIPRPSKHEQRVQNYIKQQADKNSLEWKEDTAGNLLVTKPAADKDRKWVLLQGHVDMVCEKNEDIQHDFFSDPLKLKLEEDWLKAEGTTLGADNGIGVAAALSLMDMSEGGTQLPSMEFLFTVDEETGLNGAMDLNMEQLQIKSGILINMDSEQWGEITVGCAGGRDVSVTFPVQYQYELQYSSSTAATHCYVKVEVKGFQGGHSGLNIHEHRGNAVIIMATLARVGFQEGCDVCHVQGGDKGNAIPREAYCILHVKKSDKERIEKALNDKWVEIKKEYGDLEVGMSMDTSVVESQQKVLDRACGERLLQLLLTLPHGPIKLSHVAKGLTETSTNLASVKLTDEGYLIVNKLRSSLGGPLDDLHFKIESIGKLCGGQVVSQGNYPGWAPNPKSQVLNLLKEAYNDVLGSQPEVTTIHAGLECGVLAAKIGELDMISYGPTIIGAHSPDEAVQVPTVEKFWNLTVKLLEKIATK